MRDKILCTKPYYHKMRECMAADYIRVKGNNVTTLKCKSKPVSIINQMGKNADVIWNCPEEKLKMWAKRGVIVETIKVYKNEDVWMYVGNADE